jgi:hypothetical protein
MTWDYKIFQLFENSNICSLARSIRIKWWNKFNLDLVQKSRIDEWINLIIQKAPVQKPRLLHPSQSSNESLFLQEKSRIMAELAAVSSQEEFTSKLQEFHALPSSSEIKEEEAMSSSPITNFVNSLQDNEDDCFGIFD